MKCITLSSGKQVCFDSTPKAQDGRKLGSEERIKYLMDKGKDYDNLDFAIHQPLRFIGHSIAPNAIHGTDTYKLPNHMTFSNESKYSNDQHKGGTWETTPDGRYTFTPTEWNIKNAGGKENLERWWNDGPNSEGAHGNILKFEPGGKTLVVPNSSVKLPPLSKEQQLAQQARMQGDMPIAKSIIKQQERIREEEAVKKKLAKQPTIKLSEAQKKDIAAQGLKEDVLAEQMMRNKQSLSNPDDQLYLDDLQNVLADAEQDIKNNDFGILNAMFNVPTGLISGRYETPSQAIGRFALRNDANQLRNAMIDDQGNPTGLGMAMDIFGPIALEQAIVKGISNAPTILNNAYKYNPWAYKPNPEAYYRGIGKGGLDDALQSGLIKPKNESIYSELYMSPDINIAKDYSRSKPTWTWQEVESSIPGQPSGIKQVFSPVDETSYIAEIPKSAVPNVWNTNKLVSTTTDKIPTDQVKLLKEHWLKGYKPVKVSKSTSATEALSPPHQMGFINLKGAFQKYPKGKLTQEEIEAFKNSNFYKETTKEHLDNVNKYGDKWIFPNYAEETLEDAIKTGDRSVVNHTLYGGDNWSTNNYILAGLMGTAYPAIAGLYGLAFSPPAVKNKILNNVGITSKPGVLSSNDTTINITNTPMDFAKVNETKNGKVILGGEFIEDANNTVRKAKDWLTATDTYSDQEYPSKDIQSFYGIEDGKFKVGKASEFKPETEIVPRRFGTTNISKAILNGKEMRLLDNEGNPIYQNTPNTGKFILYSPSTKEAEFNYINTGKAGVDKVNKFLKKNKDAQYIHLDNGRYEFYGLNPEGLSDQDFINYYEQDLKRKGTPGYNMIIKRDGGLIKAQEGLKANEPLGPIMFPSVESNLTKPPFALGPITLNPVDINTTKPYSSKAPLTEEEINRSRANLLIMNMEKQFGPMTNEQKENFRQRFKLASGAVTPLYPERLALLRGATLLPEAMAALELPAVVGGTTIPLATGNNILGLAGGIAGANMLSSDLNTGYYSSDAPLMDKIGRGLETGLLGFGSPGMMQMMGKGFQPIVKTGNTILNSANPKFGALPFIKNKEFIIPEEPKLSWQLEELPGLHLKSTMKGSPLEKQLSKTGEININTIKSYIGKNDVSQADKHIIDKVLNTNFQGQTKINYNDFRKAISNELIPLNKKPIDYELTHYGLGRLGFPSVNKSNIVSALEYGKNFKADLLSKININKNNPIPGSEQRIEELEKLLAETEQKILENTELLNKIPATNETILFENPKQFGTGNEKHFNDEFALGHTRTFTTNDEPSVKYLLEQQSDYFQDNPLSYLERIRNEKLNTPEKFDQRLSRLKSNVDYGKRYIDDLEYRYNNGLPDENGELIHPSRIQSAKEIYYGSLKALNRSSLGIDNIDQKIFLGKDWENRFLQEFVKDAAEKGFSKVRFPTRETAIKIQDYKPIASDIISRELIYSPKHETILKKYTDRPKSIKKFFDTEPTLINDNKGNTWYELSIPVNFKQKKAEIKAFKPGGLIKAQNGGKNINNTGYLDNSDTKHNPYNIIPSNNITMDGVSIPLLLMPDGDKARVVMPHSGEYNFPNSQYVTEIPLAQKGRKVYPQPTTQDSILLYNNQVLKDKFYKNNPNYNRVSYSGTSNADLSNIINQMDPNNLKRLIDAASSGAIARNYATTFKKPPSQYKSELEKKFKKLSNNVYSAADIVNANLNIWFNPDAPPSYFSPTIKPKNWINYYSSKYDDVTNVPMYDAFEIKPRILRTPEENIEWEKRYGKPQSKPNVRERLELETLPTKQVLPLTSNFTMEPRSFDASFIPQSSDEEYNRKYSIRIPTVDINKRQVAPRVNRVLGKNIVNPKNQYQRNIEFGSREIPIIDDYHLNKVLIKMGMEPKFETGGKIIKLSTGKIIKIK
jgi:hypothetical protein